MTIYAPRHKIITDKPEPHWWQFLLSFVAGMLVISFGYFYYQIYSYEEPVVSMASVKVEQIDENEDVIATYFGSSLLYTFGKDMDEYIIKGFNEDVVIPARGDVILTPKRINEK